MITTATAIVTDDLFVSAQFGHLTIACVRLGLPEAAYEHSVHAFRAAGRALAPYCGGVSSIRLLTAK